MNKQIKFYITIFVLTSLLFLSCCSYFEQNDFIITKTISNEYNEHIFYNVYQTGIDNYRFDFYAINGTDTTKLFDYYLNDAVFTAMKFSNTKNGDTLKIKTNLPAKNISAKTKNKIIVVLTNE
jgi:hypothetical protein